MEIFSNDIPENGKVKFDYSGATRTYFCWIEWEDLDLAHSVCGFGRTQQQALNNAIDRKGQSHE